MEAMVNKLKTVKDVDEFYKILSDVTNNIDTNMTTNQMLSFFKVIKNTIDNFILDKDYRVNIEQVPKMCGHVVV